MRVICQTFVSYINSLSLASLFFKGKNVACFSFVIGLFPGDLYDFPANAYFMAILLIFITW